MTFEEHLKQAIKQQEAKDNVRHQTREVRSVLLPLRDSQQIRDYIREISDHSGERALD
jgi:hypothetical protein